MVEICFFFVRFDCYFVEIEKIMVGESFFFV